MSTHKYKIACKVDTGEFDPDFLKGAGMGGCDELLLCSIVRFKEGKGSIAWTSMDGKSGEMKPSTMFHAWMALAAKLSQLELNNLHREIVLKAINAIKVEKIS